MRIRRTPSGATLLLEEARSLFWRGRRPEQAGVCPAKRTQNEVDQIPGKPVPIESGRSPEQAEAVSGRSRIFFSKKVSLSGSGEPPHGAQVGDDVTVSDQDSDSGHLGK